MPYKVKKKEGVKRENILEKAVVEFYCFIIIIIIIIITMEVVSTVVGTWTF
jgi:hypothetical protein